MDNKEQLITACRLVRNGMLLEAIALFESFGKDSTSVNVWNSYGHALLEIEAYVGAEQAYRKARLTRTPRPISNTHVGVALWLQGRYPEACADWREELERILTTDLRRFDSAALHFCALLWWAYRRLDLEAEWKTVLPRYKTARKLKSQQVDWYVALTSYVLGEIQLSDLMAEAAACGPYEQGEVLCQANFYIAGKSEQFLNEWKSHIQSAASAPLADAVHLPEYHIAKYELARLPT